MEQTNEMEQSRVTKKQKQQRDPVGYSTLASGLQKERNESLQSIFSSLLFSSLYSFLMLLPGGFGGFTSNDVEEGDGGSGASLRGSVSASLMPCHEHHHNTNANELHSSTRKTPTSQSNNIKSIECVEMSKRIHSISNLCLVAPLP